MKTNETQDQQTKILAELLEQYQHEKANEYGFGHPSKWLKGDRTFSGFLAEKRIADDFDKAMKLIGAAV